jgi:pimeloyl-ACP methyl ester carboxylesterase
MQMARSELGAGDPIVFLHGFPCTRLLWQPVIERMSQVGFRCIAPDLLGYGESPSAVDVGMAAQVPHLVALFDELGLRTVDLIAHDVGTAAAQLLALQHPQRLKRLVLVDGVYETEWAMNAIESIRSWDVEKASRLQPVLTRRLKPIRDNLTPNAGEAGGRQLIQAARCLDPSQTKGCTARLRETGVPISVIWGAQDEYLPLHTVGRPLAAELGVEPIVVDGGHFLPLDNPDGVVTALQRGTSRGLGHCSEPPNGAQ